MDGSVIVGLLSFAGTCLGTFGGVTLIKYRIEQLEKKVEKHNNLVERTYRIEDDIKYIKIDLQELKERDC